MPVGSSDRIYIGVLGQRAIGERRIALSREMKYERPDLRVSG
jgi:hypothetical protein